MEEQIFSGQNRQINSLKESVFVNSALKIQWPWVLCSDNSRCVFNTQYALERLLRDNIDWKYVYYNNQ